MTDPGWYQAQGDAPNTMRYWDGEAWQGEPVLQGAPIGSVPPPPSISMQSPATTPPEEKLTPFGYWKRGWTSKYADFDGRARRAEYGWFMVINWALALLLIVPSVAYVVAQDPGDVEGDLSSAFWILFAPVLIFVLVAIVPTLAIVVRRWHDQGRSGWIILLRLIPGIGSLINFVLAGFEFFVDGKPETNKWGPSPKYGSTGPRQPWE